MGYGRSVNAYTPSRGRLSGTGNGKSLNGWVSASERRQGPLAMRTGHHHGDVDLGPIIDRFGVDYDLSDRWPPCKVAGCPGVVEFIDSNSMWPRHLTRMRVNDPAWWAHTQGRRAELEAVGWRIRGGKWIAPPM